MAKGTFRIPVGPDGGVTTEKVNFDGREVGLINDLMRETGLRFANLDELELFRSSGIVPDAMRKVLRSKERSPEPRIFLPTPAAV